MKKIPVTTALRIYCAERTRATQLGCVCASDTCTIYFVSGCVTETMEVQV